MQIDPLSSPYGNFRFKLKMDGKYVAGFSKVSDLTRTTQSVKFRQGGDPTTAHTTASQTEYAQLILERGVTQDAAFSQWCNKIWDVTTLNSKDPTSLSDFRKDIVIEVYNEAGEVASSYTVYNACTSKIQILPKLDGGGNSVAIENLVLQSEGWKKE